MNIRIVTHCLATHHPHFADALCYQLSSLALHEPSKASVSITLHCYRHDERTISVVEKQQFLQSLALAVWYHDSEGELGRRCIGRNFSALYQHSDAVWFTDCDHFFGPGCLDALAALPWPEGATMIWPREIQIHKDWVTGDKALAKVGDVPKIVDIDPSEFIPKSYGKAIGGVQIVQGDFARAHGYLRDFPEWQKPAAVPFGDFRDDIAYRRFCGSKGKLVAVDIPGLFRLRHSRTSYQADKV